MATSFTPLKTVVLLAIVFVSMKTVGQNEVLNPVSPYWKTTGNSGTNGGTNFIGTTTNVSLRFRTNNNERMVIDSTGFVGIGKASPTERLDVVGNFRLSGAFMPNNNPGVADQLLMSGGPNNPSAWSPFTFGNASATTQVAKFYSLINWGGTWPNNVIAVFTINDPDCTTSSSIHVSITDVNPVLDGVAIYNVQTGNGFFNIVFRNRSGGGLTGGFGISYVAFY